MAMRNIVTKEQELLRKKSRPVEKFDEKLAQLVEDMIETMNEADGVGLAAPQAVSYTHLATYGRRTRAVIVTDSDHVILSAVQPETIGNRLDKGEDLLEEDEDE